MVLDAAFFAGTIVSFMMNGVCCMYQVNREDEFRESLRKEIQKEWFEQRQREVKEQQDQHKRALQLFEERFLQVVSKHDEESFTTTHSKLLVPSKTSEGTAVAVREPGTPTSHEEEGPPSAIETSLSSDSNSHLSVLLDEMEDLEDDKENTTLQELSLNIKGPVGILCLNRGTSTVSNSTHPFALAKREDMDLQPNFFSSTAA